MRAKKNESGYSLIEIILVLVLISIVVGVGWFVVKSNRSANISFENAKNALSTVIKNTKEKATIPKDWKTFSSQKSTISFSYPSTWTLKVNSVASSSHVLESVDIVGPNTFTLFFTVESLKGRQIINTARSCPVLYQHPTEKLSNSLYYLTEGTSTGESGSIFIRNTSSPDTKGCSAGFNINNLTPETGYQFYGNFGKGPSRLTAEFLVQPEVDIAKQIFSKLKEK